MANWSFITNHGLVLAAIARHRSGTCREIGDAVGITERAAHKIIKDLEGSGYITRVKVGRRNEYEVYLSRPATAEASSGTVGDLLVILGWRPKRRGARLLKASARARNAGKRSHLSVN